MGFTYKTELNWFHQDDPSTDPRTFDPLPISFGIKKRNDEVTFVPAWERLLQALGLLNESGKSGNSATSYRLLFLGRHGQGEHNVAEERYGILAWDEIWSKKEGDGENRWADALLTAKGVEQAQRVCKCWKDLTTTTEVRPTGCYSSPLRRCLQTAEITFADQHWWKDVRMIMTEGLREVMGVHTCDRRSSKREIASFCNSEFPGSLYFFTFEADFANEDELWMADHRETDQEIDKRVRVVLDEIVGKRDDNIISITCHTGTIASILRIVGHQEFPLQTGGVIPILVKVERTLEMGVSA